MKLRTTLGAAVAAAVLIAVAAVAPPAASAAPAWADADTATIHPGVMTFTAGAQCTANFVFHDAAGAVYIGQAAHCSGTGAANETDGCLAGSLPVGTQVEIDGATQPGTMVYNSWRTMQDTTDESNPDICLNNDFALIQLHPDDHDAVNPSIPVWGGPVGVGGETSMFEDVYSYGNSSLRLGISNLSPKTGYSLGSQASGWTHPVYTATPGVPGDSGSAFLDSQGRAMGVLSTLSAAPFPASNYVSDLGLALQYMEAHTPIDVTLANGTEPFSPGAGTLVGGLLGA